MPLLPFFVLFLDLASAHALGKHEANHAVHPSIPLADISRDHHAHPMKVPQAHPAAMIRTATVDSEGASEEASDLEQTEDSEGASEEASDLEQSEEQRAFHALGAGCKKVLARSQGGSAPCKKGAKGTAVICFYGDCKLTSGQGVHVATFLLTDKLNKTSTTKVFKTWEAGGAAEMAGVIEGLKDGDFAAIAVQDTAVQPGKKLDTRLVTAMSALGAKQAANIHYQDSYLFMALKGGQVYAEVIGLLVCPQAEIELPCPTTTTTTTTTTTAKSWAKQTAGLSALLLGLLTLWTLP
mmetsp:Transcript_101826/g.180875  ORF Transcript_101826/g.180875 Transcript_101826/m.180875 type:complete len:295 (+) Transcript_101826:69-953(+)